VFIVLGCGLLPLSHFKLLHINVLSRERREHSERLLPLVFKWAKATITMHK
jgi:hypothetical protein